jgi:hypothetical protein
MTCDKPQTRLCHVYVHFAASHSRCGDEIVLANCDDSPRFTYRDLLLVRVAFSANCNVNHEMHGPVESALRR